MSESERMNGLRFLANFSRSSPEDTVLVVGDVMLDQAYFGARRVVSSIVDAIEAPTMVIASMRRHLIKLLRYMAKLCGGVPKRRYGGGAGSDLGGAGRQIKPLPASGL